MAALIETSTWEDPIYLIERTDPLSGGINGINNIQARQLASRTLYLLNQFLREHNSDGTHRLSSAAIIQTAGILESKLALDHGTQDVADIISAANDLLRAIKEVLDNVEGLDGTSLKALYQAMSLAWKYGYPRFQFEMFTKNFTLRDDFEDIEILETIAGDDSIDVEDSATVVEGDTYVLYDDEAPAEEQSQVVTVKTVLTKKRVILYAEEHRTRLNSGVLTKCTWDTSTGLAQAEAGQVYFTGYIDLLEGFERGSLIISHDEDIEFEVSYRKPTFADHTTWLPLAMDKRYQASNGAYRSVYQTPGGTIAIQVKSLGTTTIDHIVLMTDSHGTLSSTVRTPVIVDDAFQVIRFGALYGATHVKTEVQLSPTMDFEAATTVTLPASVDSNPVWDLKTDVLTEYGSVQVGDTLNWRIRFFASDGYASAWSTIGTYTVVAGDI